MRIRRTLDENYILVLYFDSCFRNRSLALDQKEADVKLSLARFLSHKQLTSSLLVNILNATRFHTHSKAVSLMPNSFALQVLGFSGPSRYKMQCNSLAGIGKGK